MSVPFVLFPGWSFDASACFPSFAGRDVRPCAPDLLLEDPAAILTSECVVVGWSLGSFVAASLLRHPFVRGAVLISPALSFLRSAETPHGATTESLERMKEGIRTDLPSTLSGFRSLCGELPPGADGRPWSSDELLRGLDLLERARFQEDVLSVEKPVLLLTGSRDRVIPVSGSRNLHRKSGWTLLEAPGAGHGLPLTHPEFVRDAALKAFP